MLTVPASHTIAPDCSCSSARLRVGAKVSSGWLQQRDHASPQAELNRQFTVGDYIETNGIQGTSPKRVISRNPCLQTLPMMQLQDASCPCLSPVIPRVTIRRQGSCNGLDFH